MISYEDLEHLIMKHGFKASVWKHIGFGDYMNCLTVDEVTLHLHESFMKEVLNNYDAMLSGYKKYIVEMKPRGVEIDYQYKN